MMDIHNIYSININDVKVGRYVIFTITSRTKSDNVINYEVDHIGKVLAVHNYPDNCDHRDKNDVSIDLELNIPLNGNTFAIDPPKSDQEKDNMYLSLFGNIIKDKFTKINIPFDSIKFFAEPSTNKNNYGISEADIYVGLLVQIEFLRENNSYQKRPAIIEKIIPGLPGNYNFAYQLLDDNFSVELQNIVVRGPSLQSRMVVGYKSIVDIHKPSQEIKSYNLSHIMKEFFSKFIIRKIHRVNVSSDRCFSRDYLYIGQDDDIRPGWHDDAALSDKCKQEAITYINKCGEYYGHTINNQCRTINDPYANQSIFIKSKHATMFDFLFNYDGHLVKTRSSNTYRVYPPTEKSIVCGLVEEGAKGPYYSKWTTVTPQFLFLWTYIMYGTTHATTKNMTIHGIKRKLMLTNMNNLLEKNKNHSKDYWKRQSYHYRPFMSSVGMKLEEDFYWQIFNLIYNYCINDFIDIATFAQKELDRKGYLEKSIHKAALVIYKIGWYKFY